MRDMSGSSSFGSLGAGRVRGAAPSAARPDAAASRADGGDDWRQSFVDEFCERDLVPGMPRASMRVLGWMVVCTPGVQSAQQIMEELRLSAGSVSTAVNALHDNGILERVVRAGDRHVYYRLRAYAWENVLEARFRTIGEVRRAADRSLRASGGEADQRLRDLRDLCGRVELGLAEILHRGASAGAAQAKRAWRTGLTPFGQES
jgi:predicted DNA-binding transcriptional regulator